jgi:hypothetical protein
MAAFDSELENTQQRLLQANARLAESEASHTGTTTTSIAITTIIINAVYTRTA